MAPLLLRAALVPLALAAAELLFEGAQLTASAKERERSLEKTWGAGLLEHQGPVHTGAKVQQHQSPVQRVVSLLRKMKGELEHEADNEANMYDKMVCWCETTQKEKTKAVSDAEATANDLEAEIESRSANFGRLSTQIEALKGHIAEGTKSAKESASIREGEASAFRDDEKASVAAMTNLKNAITVLKRHQGSSLLQLEANAPLMSSVRTVLREAAFQYQMMRGDSAPPSNESPKHISLIALSQGASASSRAEMRVTHALTAALDLQSDSVGEPLPLKFAARILERSAHATDSGKSFLQVAGPAGGASYNPQSGQIFGILQQMYDEFEKNLKQSQKDEKRGAEEHKAMASAKVAELEASKAKLDEMETEHAENQKALSDAKDNLDTTRAQRTADVEFLTTLGKTCNDLDSQWEQRSKARARETRAVAEAISVLMEDTARETTSRAVAFFQMVSTQSAALGSRRSAAAAALRSAADDSSFDTDDLFSAWNGRGDDADATSRGSTATPRMQLSALAVSVQQDSFTEVKQAMDRMIAELKSQQQEEVDLKAYCQKEFNKNEKATSTKEEEKEDNEGKINKLTELVKKMDTEVAEAKQQIADTDTEILKGGQTREAENAIFQETVADQRATQTIIKEAHDRLKTVYTGEPAGGAVLLQQTPPVQFSGYKQNGGASPVMGLMEQIIEDSKRVEAQSVADEAKAQENYQTFVKNSNTLIEELKTAVTEKTEQASDAKVDMEDAQSDHEGTVEDLDSLAQQLSDLHGECDFVVKNFDIRQKARLQEIEAISQAKAILSGAGSQ